MHTYRVNRVKPVSNARRYEHLAHVGVTIKVGRRNVVLRGKELSDYLDEQIWRAAHPGQEPVTEWSDAVPPQ